MNFCPPQIPLVQYCKKCGWVCRDYIIRSDVIFRVKCPKCKTDEFMEIKPISEFCLSERVAIKLAQIKLFNHN